MIDAITQLLNNRGSMKRYLHTISLYLAGIALCFSLTVTVHAAESWKFPPPSQFGKALQGTPMNSESSVHSSNIYGLYSLSCLGVGFDCTDNPADMQTYIQNSAFGKLNDVVALTFTQRPADTGLWIADTGRTLGFIPQQAFAQGQGIGFSGMAPLLPVWKAFRNVAYLLMAIVMIVLGFMIMFRKKIDPHTVVTAQNAIPKVVLALILITFSYAIVGILIDFMYVIIYILIALFKSTTLLDAPQGVALSQGFKTPEQLYGQGGLMQNFFNLSWDVDKILFGTNAVAQATAKYLSVGGIIFALALATVPGAALIAAPVGIASLSIPIIHVILTVAIIFLFVRLVAFFLMSYIQIILSLLLAPLQLMMEAIPGSTAFSSWFNNLISNLAVFPIGAGMFMLANVFTHFSNNASAGKLWTPPYAPVSGDMAQIASLVSLGVLFAIPTVAGSVKEALKAKPAFAGAGGGGGGALASALSYGSQISSLIYYMKHIKGEKAAPQMLGAGKPPPGVDHE